MTALRVADGSSSPAEPVGDGFTSTAKETVLLIGAAQPSAAATAQSLARAGYRVLGAWRGGRLAGRSRYCDELFRVPPSADTQAFLAAVNRICELRRVAAVVPLAEESLGALVAGRDPDAPWQLVGPSRRVFDAVCNKAGLLETLRAAGLPSPASTLVTPDGALGEQPPLPSYVKIVSGVESGNATGRPRRVTDARERDELVRSLVAGGRTVLVQEEVEGELWRFHFAHSHGRISHVGVRTIYDYPYRIGESTVSSFERAPDGLVEAALALLAAVGYDGVGSLGFLRRGGEFFAHDINLRMLGSIRGTIAAGLDLPRLGVEMALGRSPILTPIPVRRLRFAHLHGELAALRGALRGEFTGRSAAAVVRELALAAVLPGRMLYPLDLSDPLPILAVLSRATRPRYPAVL